MGIKATNQITIVDLSDAYSVMLTSEAYTFVGNVNGAVLEKLVLQRQWHFAEQISVHP